MWKLFPRWDWYKIRPEDLGESNCVFCDLETEKKDLILWIWKYFHIRHNKFPYLWLENNLLAIPNRHVVLTSDLTKEEFYELKEVEAFMKDYYCGGDYFSFIRETSAWKSLNHLHYHFLPGRVADADIEKMLKKQWY